MEYIFVVDKKDVPTETRLGSINSFELKAFSVTESVANISLAAISPAASLVSMVSAHLAQRPAKDEKPTDGENDFLRQCSLTEEMTKDLGYIFPPDHPKINYLYRIHPRAHFSNENADLYIPIDEYDALVMEDKKGELISILAELGANYVSIAAEQEGVQKNAQFAHFSANGPSGSVGAQGISEKAKSEYYATGETYHMTGKPWKRGDQLDRRPYVWLKSQPTWERTVCLREDCGCHEAELKIEARTSETSLLKLDASARIKVLNLKSGMSQESEQTSRSSISVKVKFNTPTE